MVACGRNYSSPTVCTSTPRGTSCSSSACGRCWGSDLSHFILSAGGTPPESKDLAEKSGTINGNSSPTPSHILRLRRSTASAQDKPNQRRLNRLRRLQRRRRHRRLLVEHAQ